MLPASSLSTAAYSLRQMFLTNIDELNDLANIRIGHPADNLKELEDIDENCLNLFFYNVNYDGYPADGSSDNPFYVRLHCLITSIGHKSSEAESPGSTTMRDVSKGENELRLIGEVMRVLHEKPVLTISDTEGNAIVQLQLVPDYMNLDNLNHIWSTQTDTSYRLSVSYEMSLAPVPYTRPAETSPIVAESGMVVWGQPSRDADKERNGIISLQPQVEFLEVDTSVKNWTPHICFVKTGEDDSKQLLYVAKPAGDLADPLDILVAGKAGGKVRLYWNLWRKKSDNSIEAWQQDIADTQTPLEKIIESPVDPDDPFNPAIVDPDDIDDESLFKVMLPAAVTTTDTKLWQAVLYAVHEWTPNETAGSGETNPVFIKSNTVMFYGGSA